MTKEFDISLKVILKIAFAIFLFYLLFQTRQVLLWILYAFIISILIERPIEFLTKRGISRTISTILVYFFSFAFFIFLVYFLSLPLFGEIQNFLQFFPQYFEKISPSLRALGFITFETFEELTQKLREFLFEASKNIVSAVSSIFGGLFSAFSILSLAIFLSLEKKETENFLFAFFGKRKEFAKALWFEAKEKISRWFGARILTCFLVFILTYVSLLALKIKYPLSLSFLAGILDFIPILGPIFAGTLIFIFAILDSFFKAIFIIILFILIQLIEGNIISPLLAERFVGFSPFFVLVSLLIGGKLMGPVGAILAVPLAGIFFKILEEVFKEE